MDAQLQFFTTSRGFTNLHILCALLNGAPHLDVRYQPRISTFGPRERWQTLGDIIQQFAPLTNFILPRLRAVALPNTSKGATQSKNHKHHRNESRRWRSTGKLENRVDCQTHRCPPPKLPVNFVGWWMIIAITPLIARFSLAERRHSHLQYPRPNASCLYLYQVPFLLPTSIISPAGHPLSPAINLSFHEVAWRPKTAPSHLKVRVTELMLPKYSP